MDLVGTYGDNHSTIVIHLTRVGVMYSDYPSGRQGRLVRSASGHFVVARAGSADSVFTDSPAVSVLGGSPPKLRVAESDGTVRMLDRIILVEEDVQFANDTVRLEGTLVRPTTRGPVGAVVFVHGSGPATRASFGGWARLFARHGIAAFTYDKRGTGSSTGDFSVATLDDLAADAAAAVRALRSRRSIDAARVGLLGTSQGGWIIPKANALEPVAFLVFSSGGAVSAAQQEAFRRVGLVQRAGYAPATVDSARRLIEFYFRYLSTLGRSHADSMSRLWDLYHTRPWYNILDMPRTDPTKNPWPAWRLAFGRDLPLDEQSFRRIRVPVLVLSGADDETMPSVAVHEGFESLLSAEARPTLKISIFPQAGHGATLPAARGAMTRVAQDYFGTMLTWVSERIVSPASTKTPSREDFRD